MAWWTAVPALTAVSAWDAKHFDGVQLADLAGTRPITWHGEAAELSPYASVSGAGKICPLASPLTVTGDRVIFAMVKMASRFVCFYKTAGIDSSYLISQESNGVVYPVNNGSYTAAGTAPAFGTLMLMAFAVTASTARLYINGNWAGPSIASSYIMDTIGGMGYVADGDEYNFDANDRLYAAGVLTGTATLADLQALEAAVKADLVPTPANAAYRPLAALRSLQHPLATQPGPYPLRLNDAPAARRNLLAAAAGGPGRIVGTVKRKGTPNAPLARRVVLYAERTGAMVGHTWSAAADGAYEFTGLSLTERYTVVAYDHEHVYGAVIADNLQATP
ncbi:MAG: hypothetical protein ACK40S_10960 [Burkholderiaceae bacterium]